MARPPVPPVKPTGVAFASPAARSGRALPEFGALRTALPALVTIAGGVMLWQLLVIAFKVPKFLLPGPVDVVSRMISGRDLLLSHAATTASEVLLGFGVATLVGVSLGILMVVSKFFDRALSPLLVTVQAVPKIAIAPLLIVWFGFDLTPKVLTAFMVAVFPVVINTAAGFRQTPKEMVDLARSMGASTLTMFRTFRLPIAMPIIFAGLKMAAALAVVGAVSGEFVAANAGLGYLLLTASSTVDSVGVFSGIIALSLEGIILYGLVELVERFVSPLSRRARRLERNLDAAMATP